MSQQIEEHIRITFDQVSEEGVQTVSKRPPTYLVINDLAPDIVEVNIKEAVVVNITKVWEKTAGDGTLVRIYDVVLGDHTGVIHITARDSQCDFFAIDKVVSVLGARSVLYKTHCTLELDDWSKVTVVQNPTLNKSNVNTSNNVSKIEFEAVE
ncbi:hypothetical protein RCL1_003039 [Eukaryota sp. TZLM3-RCL]